MELKFDEPVFVASFKVGRGSLLLQMLMVFLPVYNGLTILGCLVLVQKVVDQ